MMDFEPLRTAAANMLTVNMNLKDGERVAFVADIPVLSDWKRFDNPKLDEINQRAMMTRRFCEMMRADFPANPFEFLCFPITAQHGAEPSDEFANQLREYDVLVIMTTHSMTHTNARANACKAGARVASMPAVEAGMFAPGGPMAADYRQIAAESVQWAEKITSASAAHITTPFGTDLRFSIAGRKGQADTGLIHERGTYGNLPGGEAFIAPMEGTASGRLVVPAGWFPELNEEMTLIFKDGYVVELLGGGRVGAEFTRLFAFGDDSKKHRRNCAELGIGTNPNAKTPNNVLEAEKIRGTVHVAVGDSSHMGGANSSDLHEDFVLTQPTVWLDGKKVIG